MKKIILSTLAIYLLIGIFIAFKVDPSSRGGVAGATGFILGWPLIFFIRIS